MWDGNRLFKKEAVELHRILWNYIADDIMSDPIYQNGYLNVGAHKERAIARMADDGLTTQKPYSWCFCCEYDRQAYHIYNKDYKPCKSCKYCPIQWSAGKCFYSEYAQLNQHNISRTDAACIARKIANLPERTSY